MSEDNRQIFFEALKSAGLNSQQALGALWSLGGESGGSLDTSAYNPDDPGGSVGAGQWLGSRRTGLEAYARQQGVPVTDAHLQARYLVGELNGSVPTAQVQQGVLAALKNARSPEEAAHIWTAQFERPKVDNSGQRIASGGAVGSLDANGNFVPGSAKAITSPGDGRAFAGGARNILTGAPMAQPPSLGEMVGQAFASVGAATAPSAPFQDPEDVPNAPSVAAQTNFAPRDAVPASATSVSARPVSGILAGLAAQNPSQPQDAANFLNAGAPSMTGLLNPMAATNFSDPRRTAGPNPFAAPTPRLA